MLLQFKFKNFRSFKNEAVLDMTATKVTEYSTQVIDYCHERTLPAAAILGANASGKSNLIDAFSFMNYWVLHSYSFNNERTYAGTVKHPYNPFFFDAGSSSLPTEMEVFVTIENEGKPMTYDYGFSVDRTDIKEEWLNIKKTRTGEFHSVFYREGNKIDDDNSLGKVAPFVESNIHSNVLALSLTEILNIEVLRPIYRWFAMNHILCLDPEMTVLDMKMVPPQFATDKALQKSMLRFLSTFDTSIKDFSVKTEKAPNGEIRMDIKTLHKVKGSDKLMPISLEMESSGTQKMFALYKHLADVLKNGSVFFVDELDSRLHPLLVRLIVNTFINKETNPNHAQIVFSTHDSWQLISDQLRRDELWFTDKNEDQESELYSLSDFRDQGGDKIRKDENLQKNYMLGKYGAIPTLQPFNMFQEDTDGKS